MVDRPGPQRVAPALALTTALALAAASGCDTAVQPGPDALAGQYALDHWDWRANGDEFPITDGSYVQIRFGSRSEVSGEGFVQVVLPPADGAGPDTVAILSHLALDGEIGPLEVRGWYSIHPGAGSAPDTLRFRLQRGYGAYTWLEDIDWMLAHDQSAFSFDFEGTGERLQIVYRRQ